MAHLGTNKLTLIIDGEERAAEVSTAEIVNSETDSDFVSFADAAAGGGRDWALHIVAVQDPGDPDSLLNLTWDMAGTNVDVIVRPYGNATASATQPHYSGTVTVKYPDGVLVGGEADASESARFTFDVEWPFVVPDGAPADAVAKPTRVIS
jgi:hypothetical protein